jgi:hypothetical protein
MSIGIIRSTINAFHSNQVEGNIIGLGTAIITEDLDSNFRDFFRHWFFFNVSLNLFPDICGILDGRFAACWASDGLQKIHLIHHSLAVRMNVMTTF